MIQNSENSVFFVDGSTESERRIHRKRKRSECKSHFIHTLRLGFYWFILSWPKPIMSVEVMMDIEENEIIYTKPSNQGIGLKLPTGYEQYRKAKKNYQLKHLQRNNTNKGSSRQEKIFHRLSENLCRTSPIKLLLRGIESIARAAYETNEFALKGTTLHPYQKFPEKIKPALSDHKNREKINFNQNHLQSYNENDMIQGSLIPSHDNEYPHPSIPVKKESGPFDESLDPFTKDGAKLLSASFRVLSNSVGLTADMIRISGETFAGAFGSSVKIIGSSFTSAASSLDRLAYIVSHDSDITVSKQQDGSYENAAQRPRKPLTSEKLFDRSAQIPGHSTRFDKVLHEDQRHTKPGVVENTRKVAGKSMRLISSVVRGIGNSIVVAGAASESLTASTASVAEDTVRIVEEFAKSIADAFHVEENYDKGSTRPLSEYSMEDKTWETVEDWKELKSSSKNTGGSFVYYGTDDDEVNNPIAESESSAHLSSPTVMELLSAGDSVFWTLFHFIREKTLMEFYFATEPTEGVSALATDLLGVLFICFISSILLLKQKRDGTRNSSKRKVEYNDSPSNSIHLGGNGSFLCTIPPNSLCGAENTRVSKTLNENYGDAFKSSRNINHCDRVKLAWPTASVLRIIYFLLCLPIHYLSLIRNVLMNRYVILFSVHFFGGWLLCNSSQFRSLEIQRKSEVLGYRSAIESFTSSQAEFSLNESATWLNIILARLWRVPLRGTSPYTEHPYFITRTIPITKDGYHLYDGLEPYVSSLIGSILKESWETPELPNEIAYVSLHSFTLGSHPPIIRGIEVHNIDNEFNSIHLRIALDLLLSDSSLIFDFRISSLDYALLPVTQIKISSIDVRLDLDLRLDLIPRYPFVSLAKVSIARLPVVSVQIVPLNEDSGLRGINLSQLPVISDWVQSTIRRCLLEYLWPHYIAFDIERYWSYNNCKDLN